MIVTIIIVIMIIIIIIIIIEVFIENTNVMVSCFRMGPPTKENEAKTRKARKLNMHG